MPSSSPSFSTRSRPQPGGQDVVDASLGGVQVGVHTDGRHIGANKIHQQLPLEGVASDRLDRAPGAVHHRVVGGDELAVLLRRLTGHRLGDVQSYQDPADLLFRLPHQ